MRNVIELADSNGLKRIAVPAISTGVYGYPRAEAGQMLVATAMEYSEACVNLEEIRFVVVSNKGLEVFQAAESRRDATQCDPMA